MSERFEVEPPYSQGLMDHAAHVSMPDHRVKVAMWAHPTWEENVEAAKSQAIAILHRRQTTQADGTP